MIVVILDVAIVLSLIISLYMYVYIWLESFIINSFYRLEKYESIADNEVNDSLLTAEDFAVVIKNLPEREAFNSVKELKALLWDYLEKVVKDEKSIFKNQNGANIHKIMNIHFGLTDFSKLKILMKTYNLIKE